MRRVELGDPSAWVRGSSRIGPFDATQPPVARTAAESWVALYSESDALVGAVSRWCPHRGADLLEHAGYHPCPGALMCRHTGYSWWIASGAVRSRGGPEQAAPFELHQIRVRRDGSAYIDVEEDRRR
ncbi:MAG TPA: Rieske 2Fe-2S domain-containing protein [Solirubrobacteraceae bacterium]|nr:Rieske 2Fe-2S domain-containing protein [Solirubrobacteraceae bacterium]